MSDTAPNSSPGFSGFNDPMDVEPREESEYGEDEGDQEEEDNMQDVAAEDDEEEESDGVDVQQYEEEEEEGFRATRRVTRSAKAAAGEGEVEVAESAENIAENVSSKEKAESAKKDTTTTKKKKGDRLSGGSGAFEGLAGMLKAAYTTETEAWPYGNPQVSQAAYWAIQEQNRLQMNGIDDLKKLLAASGGRAGMRSRSQSIAGVGLSDDDEEDEAEPTKRPRRKNTSQIKTTPKLNKRRVDEIVDANWKGFFDENITTWLAESGYQPISTKTKNSQLHSGEWWPKVVEQVEAFNKLAQHNAARRENNEEEPELHALTNFIDVIKETEDGIVHAYARACKNYQTKQKNAQKEQVEAEDEDDEDGQPSKVRKTSARAMATDKRNQSTGTRPAESAVVDLTAKGSGSKSTPKSALKPGAKPASKTPSGNTSTPQGPQTSSRVANQVTPFQAQQLPSGDPIAGAGHGTPDLTLAANRPANAPYLINTPGNTSQSLFAQYGNPPVGAGRGTTPVGAGRGTTPVGAGRGTTPVGAGRGTTPVGAGRGNPPVGAGRGTTPVGAGRGTTPVGAGRGTTPVGAGRGNPPVGAGRGVTPTTTPSSRGTGGDTGGRGGRGGRKKTS